MHPFGPHFVYLLPKPRPPLQKVTAILLLLVFSISLYGRQLRYWECKISSLLQSAAAACDCEKKAGFALQEDDPQPVSHPHSHVQADEYYLKVSGYVPFASQLSAGSRNGMNMASPLPESDIPGPWRPPNPWNI